jgi:hypothetical protein
MEGRNKRRKKEKERERDGEKVRNYSYIKIVLYVYYCTLSILSYFLLLLYNGINVEDRML